MTRLPWRGLLSGLAVAVALVGLAIAGMLLPLLWQVGLWALLLFTGLILQACGLVKLFGPVLFYDMVRLARRGRYFLLRLLYGGIILFVMFCYWTASPGVSEDAAQNYYAALAMAFFNLLLWVQMIAICVLTPAYVGGAIAEEKERRTLEFMLASDLRNREIVLSKLVARLANLTLIIITGLPILSLLQFLGGIDPELLLLAFLATAVTMVSLACYCLACSVYFKKPRDAIAFSYLGLIVYIFVGVIGWALQQGAVPWLQVRWFWDEGPNLADAITFLNSGNPLVSAFRIYAAYELDRLQTELDGILRQYTTFHEVFALLCLAWSVWRLRVIALKQAQATAGKPRRWLAHWSPDRPPVSDAPVLWKEVYVEGRRRPTVLGMILVGILVLLTLGFLFPLVWDMEIDIHSHLARIQPTIAWEVLFRATLPCVFLLVLAVRSRTTYALILCVFVTVIVSLAAVFLLKNRNDSNNIFEEAHIWSVGISTIVACLILLGVAVRASSCISSERDRNTFDFLLTTPLDSDTILWGKFLGCLYSLRLPLVWLGTIWWLALWLEGLSLLDVLLQFLALLIYACAFTLIGLWFSMVCRNSTRATVGAIFTVLVVSAGHWLPTFCCVVSAHFSGRQFDDVLMFQTGLTPPAVLGALPATSFDLRHYASSEEPKMMVFCLIGLAAYTIASLVFWFAVLSPRFRKLTNRDQSM